jgi:hypothetical protein
MGVSPHHKEPNVGLDLPRRQGDRRGSVIQSQKSGLAARGTSAVFPEYHCFRRTALHESAFGVRRAKAALFSGCKSHPATAPAGSNRSSHGGNEVAEAFG